MPKILDPLIWTWGILSLVFAALWLRQLKTKNANAVDVAWSLGFLVPAVVGLGAFSRSANVMAWRPQLVAALVALWSLRLGWYLLKNRVLTRHSEDGRYAKLRTENGWGPGAFLMMYQFQALLVVFLSIPLFTAMASDVEPLRMVDVAAVALWFVAVIGETLADAQLNRFRKNADNRGKTCQVGLWRYSRHPNYFFEWLHWWTYVLLAWGASSWWLSLLGPAIMLWFLIKVTGLPATEAQALRTRVDYREYQKSTSAFVPWFRK